MRNETSKHKVEYAVQERLSDGFWYGVKLFAQKENAEEFAKALHGEVRVTPIGDHRLARVV